MVLSGVRNQHQSLCTRQDRQGQRSPNLSWQCQHLSLARSNLSVNERRKDPPPQPLEVGDVISTQEFDVGSGELFTTAHDLQKCAYGLQKSCGHLLMIEDSLSAQSGLVSNVILDQRLPLRVSVTPVRLRSTQYSIDCRLSLSVSTDWPFHSLKSSRVCRKMSEEPDPRLLHSVR